LGNNVSTYWNNLIAGKSGIAPLTHFNADAFKYKQAAEIKDFFQLTHHESFDRATLYLLEAAQEAMQQSEFAALKNRDEVAIVLATNFGAISVFEEFCSAERSLNSMQVYKDYTYLSVADHLADKADLHGPRMCLSHSCSSGTVAIGVGMDLIRHGHAKLVIAGGFDMLSPYVWSGLSALRTMTPEKMRPFDKNRKGTIFGEGAGVIILEDWNHARKRGIPIEAEILGYASNNNAFHMAASPKDGDGLANAMQMAFNHAGIAPDRIDHINTHGTATQQNDSSETNAIKKVFKEGAYKIPLNSIKAAIGHTMGAAGALEAIAVIRTLQMGIIPPTLNYMEADPCCDLDITPNFKVEKNINTVMSNSSGIGGNNACVIFGKGDQ